MATAEGDDELDEENWGAVLAQLKAEPGGVSLATLLEEIDKLETVRAIGLPANLFAGVAPRVVASWRSRAAAEAPSHLRSHPWPARVTLLAALLYAREREITDGLVELLLSTVHRINAKAEKRVVEELLRDFKRVTGKENILYRITEASLEAPDDPVRKVVYPAAGGEQTLQDLRREFHTSGSTIRQHKQRVLKASYTNHYGKGLIALLGSAGRAARPRLPQGGLPAPASRTGR